MRASSTQKTYDEAFLACSTAVYFESKNNEPEALRSWRSALDHIYYHNAHRPPSTSTSRPASETEKALQESLHQLELQCKERVDLLEALKRSREEANENVASPSSTPDPNAPLPPSRPVASPEAPASTWLGGGTVPPVDYTHLSRPPLPYRPSLPSRKSSGSDTGRANINPQAVAASSLAPSPVGRARDSRTPSPEKKGRMLRTLRPGKDGKPAAPRLPTTMRSRPPEAAKAATQAWGFKAGSGASTSKLSKAPAIVPTRSSFDRPASALDTDNPYTQPPASEAYTPQSSLHVRPRDASCSETYPAPSPVNSGDVDSYTRAQLPRKEVTSPTHSGRTLEIGRMASNQANSSGMLAYRNEYPMTTTDARFLAASAAARSYSDLESGKSTTRPSDARKTSTTSQQSSLSSNKIGRHRKEPCETVALENDDVSRNEHTTRPAPRRRGRAKKGTAQTDQPPSSTSEVEDSCGSEDDSDEWKERVNGILKNLPRGVDKSAAQQILNEIVIQGDEVRWDDVAGLEVAKSALKETVVYPFLRPDLFMGLREPARGMLLFGPPGTGKTMLARAVATESSSTFFAISASSLTSKFLGESEKLVRALFALAKLLAPSIIFVDEIDSLLSSRSSSSEHEATRRIKTEFLIQWSDLAKAAAGREQGDKEKERGDATRVLVLAATNLPWAIDEAARRRFVRRQYIPLPEDHVRKTQVKTLLSHQKHELNDMDLDRLVQLTDGFSGSDITALAKDAAMGPLRSLGERLLHMTMDEIRPIRFEDFQASLQTIRPSVSKQGLNEYEAWAKEFGERGG